MSGLQEALDNGNKTIAEHARWCAPIPHFSSLAHEAYKLSWVENAHVAGMSSLHLHFRYCHHPYVLDVDARYLGIRLSNEAVAACLPIAKPSPSLTSKNNNNACTRSGSIIQTSNQVLGETIPLVGVPFYLTHFSNRVTGRKGDYQARLDFSEYAYDISIHAGIVQFAVSDDEHKVLATGENLTYLFNPSYYLWNGLDASQNETWASRNRHVKTIIRRTTGVGTGTDGGQSVPETTISESVATLKMGHLKAKKLGIGGWLPSIWHFYDELTSTLYDGDGGIREVQAIKEGLFNRVASADGSEVYYFDSIGRIARIKTGLTGALIYTFTYDQREHLSAITDAFNKTTQFTYDLNGNIVDIVSAENIKTSLVLDANGYLAKVTNPKNEVYSMLYKGTGGLLARFVKPGGNTSNFTYDADGNLLTDKNSSGFSSTLYKTFSGVSAVSSMGLVTQNLYSNIPDTEDVMSPSGMVSTFKFTNAEESTTLPYANFKKSFTPDPRFGDQVKNVATMTNQNFGSTLTTLQTSVALSDPGNPFAINSLTKTITEGNSVFVVNYDGLTRTQTVTSKLGRKVTTRIDNLERPVLEQTGTLTPKTFQYDQNVLTTITEGARVLSLDYDPQTRLLQSVTNSLNQTIGFEYDEAQRLKTKTLADGRVVSYTYDANGNLTSLTPPGRPVHRQVFGKNEQLSLYKPPLLTGEVIVNTSYAYNLDKQITKITRPDGEEINFEYAPPNNSNSHYGKYNLIKVLHIKNLISLFHSTESYFSYVQQSLVEQGG